MSVKDFKMFRCQSYIYIYTSMLNLFMAMRSKFVSGPSISAMWKNILNKYSNDRQMKEPWMTVCLFSTAFLCYGIIMAKVIVSVDYHLLTTFEISFVTEFFRVTLVEVVALFKR